MREDVLKSLSHRKGAKSAEKETETPERCIEEFARSTLQGDPQAIRVLGFLTKGNRIGEQRMEEEFSCQ